MSKVINLSDKKRIRETARDKAGELLARLDAGATVEELQQIEQWLTESPVHKEVFLEMAALWDELTVLSSLSEVFPLESYSPRANGKAAATSWRGWAAACALVVITAGSWFLVNEFRQDDGQMTAGSELVHQSYVTAIGEYATVVLPDKSEVILNTNTEMEVVFTGTARNIFLKQGEGLFNVSKDPSRPFRVYAGKRMVEAVGTSFTVQHTSPDNIEVVVREGKVNFLRLSDIMQPQTLPANVDEVLFRDESVSLVAGDLAAVGMDAGDALEMKQIQQDEIEVKLAWTHGMLLFQGMSLEDVLKEMNRYTTTIIEADASISGIHVEGYFRAGDVDGLLVAMKNNFRIEARSVGEDHILLYAGE